MNLQDRDVELTWRQITCQRTVAGDVFSRGIQDFDFSVSGKNAFIPSLSYFIIEADLSVVPTNAPRIVEGYNNGGVVDPAAVPLVGQELPLRRPSLADGIALADHFGSCLYNNAYFRAGNSDVSFIQQFIPQAGVVKSRLDKSFAWTKSIGRSVMMDDPDFERRRNYVSLDGVFHDDGLKPKQYDRRRLLTNNYSDATQFAAGVQYAAATGLLTITPSNVVCNPAITGIRTGDILVVAVTTNSGAGTAPAAGSPYYFQVSVPETGFILNTAQNGAVSFDVTPLAVTLNIDAGSNAGLLSCQVAHDPACGTNRVQVVYQPPIGIFSEANPISGGDFKVVLNPSPNFATAGVQSLSPLTAYQQGLRVYDYKLDIRNVFFYVCQIKSDVSPTGIIPISLIEMAVLNKNMNPSPSQSLDFTVPPSTLAITVFVQAGVAGTTTCLPSTKFLLANIQPDGTLAQNTFTQLPIVSCEPNFANDIQSIQVSYGSVTKTQTLYTSEYKNNSTQGVNFNIQRFLQTQQYSQKIISEGGSESHPQFLERGNMWHFDFSKDKNDTSSYVSVQIAFPQAVPVGSELFIIAHYSRQCEISYENGFVTQVVSVNR
jgi:hypothetical protein